MAYLYPDVEDVLVYAKERVKTNIVHSSTSPSPLSTSQCPVHTIAVTHCQKQCPIRITL